MNCISIVKIDTKNPCRSQALIFSCQSCVESRKGCGSLRECIAKKGSTLWVVQTEGGKRVGDWDSCMSE
jgi:hypothetical protein